MAPKQIRRRRSGLCASEVIRKLFTTYDVRKVLELAGTQALEVGDVAPPTVSILSPKDGSTISSTNLTLRVKVGNNSKEPATALKVFVDGRQMQEHKLSGTLKSVGSKQIRGRRATKRKAFLQKANKSTK